ncbi:MAG: alpha/beta hydrolase [Rubrimonas sp.]|uniref:alpha/beta hydrolase n=1 Tax=Rubrimonas sp. TaxID=2036015 RepID=UPI002FDD7675
MTLRTRRRDAASGRTKSLAVLLHGYGADGADLIGLADMLAPALPDTVFIAPDAPQRCSVNPMGYQWFPIPWIDGSSEAAMQAGFRAAAATLDAWLSETIVAEGLTAARTALLGFSQGAMMSLHVAPRRPDPVAAIVAFSGRYMEAAEEGPILSKPPILLTHGDRDEVIPVGALHEARAALGAQGFELRWHVSPGVGHGIGPDALALAAEFLAPRLRGAAAIAEA